MIRVLMKTLAVAIAGFAPVAMAAGEPPVVPAANPNNHPLNAACKLLTNDEVVQVLGAGPFLAWQPYESAELHLASCRFVVQGTRTKYAFFTLNVWDYGSVEAAKAAWAAKEADMQDTIDRMNREKPVAGGAVTHIPGYGDDALAYDNNVDQVFNILKGQYQLEVDDLQGGHLSEVQVYQAAKLALPKL